jgi:alpha-glucosidase
LPPAAAGVLSRVPVAWDETRCLAGTPGSHVVIARRRGQDWFGAGINGRPEPTTVDLDLAELADADITWLVLGDGPHRDDLTETRATAGRAMSVVMAPHGGFLVATSRG